MRRSPRVLLAWFAAIAVALTTAHVVGRDLATLHRHAAALGPLHTVVIATRDLALGQTVSAGDLRTEHRYSNEIPHEALSDARVAVGRVVVVPVLRDAIVFAHHLAAANRTELDAVIPVGDRAVHVTPKDGFRPPLGTVVDVLAAFDPTAVTVEGAGDAAVIVASGARVLGIDSDASDGDGNDAQSGVTLLVTDTEARVIAFAATTGDLTLAVDPPESACCTDPSR